MIPDAFLSYFVLTYNSSEIMKVRGQLSILKTALGLFLFASTTSLSAQYYPPTIQEPEVTQAQVAVAPESYSFEDQVDPIIATDSLVTDLTIQDIQDKPWANDF